MSLDLSPAGKRLVAYSTLDIVDQFERHVRKPELEADFLWAPDMERRALEAEVRALSRALADAQKARDSLMRRIGGEIDRCILAETKLAEAHQHLATALELVDVPIGRDVEKLAAARAYALAHPPRGTGGEP